MAIERRDYRRTVWVSGNLAPRRTVTMEQRNDVTAAARMLRQLGHPQLAADLMAAVDQPGHIYEVSGHARAPEGIVAIHGWFDRFDATQHWSFLAVIRGELFERTEKRTPRNAISQLGATRIALAWLRELYHQPEEGT